MKKLTPLLLIVAACGSPAAPDGKPDPAQIEERKFGFTLGAVAMATYARERHGICTSHLLKTVTSAMTTNGSHVAMEQVLNSIEAARVLCSPLSLSDINTVLTQLNIEPLPNVDMDGVDLEARGLAK